MTGTKLISLEIIYEYVSHFHGKYLQQNYVLIYKSLQHRQNLHGPNLTKQNLTYCKYLGNILLHR